MTDDLSRRVAEVMGWYPSAWPGIFFSPEGKMETGLPSYSTDLGLAMTLVEEDGSWLELTTAELERDVCHAIVWIEMQSGQAEHKEPASAICIAWLEAKGAGLMALGEE